ncbi:MAG: NAD-dependent epimerase/dehydratase family protein [Chloroflexota bacterium]
MILVTGHNGFVGRSLMRAFENQNEEVVGFSGRLNDPFVIREQVQGVETIVHLASAESSGRERLLNRIDVRGTERLIREAIRAGVNHIIYVSRVGADANSLFPVLRTKGIVEKMLLQSDIPTTILRASTLYGRDDRFLTPIISLAVWNWPVVWLPAGGTSILQPLWVEDLVKCIIELTDPLDLKGYRGQIYTVAGEERFNYEELVRLVIETANINRRPVPIRMMWVRLATRILLGWQRRPPVTLFFLDRLNAPEIVDLDVVYRAFGFHPVRLRDQISYLRRPGLARYVFR